MTLLQITVMYAVHHYRSFTRAAEALNMSQSAVSHALKSLESELGLQIFIRNKAGVHLTKFGESMLPHVVAILKQTELIEQKAAMEKNITSGSITIGSFPSASYEILPQLINQFHQTYPHIKISILEGRYEEIEHWLQSGTVDIGLLDKTGAYDTVAVFRDEYQVVLPEDHQLAAKKTIMIEDLKDTPFIMPLSGCEKILRKHFKAHNIHPPIVLEAEFTSTVIAMVKSKLGVSVIPSSAPKFEGIISRSITPSIYREINMVVNGYEVASPAVKRWVEVCRRRTVE